MTLRKSHLPRHIAIIMDGNRRWAKAHSLPALAGHKKVVEERVEELIEHAGELGISYITFWAFSTENWGRSDGEVSGIMNLFRWALQKRAKRLIERGARLNMIGDRVKFPDDIRTGFEEMMEASKKNTKITATFALNYGGRDEIVRAMRGTIEEILRQSGSSHRSRYAQDDSVSLESMALMSNEAIEKKLEASLDTAGMPDPDLIIRTSGEQRLSGFMPWQSVYAELYFPETLMPDFGAKALDVALEEYGRRKRRFGK